MGGDSDNYELYAAAAATVWRNLRPLLIEYRRTTLILQHKKPKMTNPPRRFPKHHASQIHRSNSKTQLSKLRSTLAWPDACMNVLSVDQYLKSE